MKLFHLHQSEGLRKHFCLRSSASMFCNDLMRSDLPVSQWCMLLLITHASSACELEVECAVMNLKIIIFHDRDVRSVFYKRALSAKTWEKKAIQFRAYDSAVISLNY